MLTYRVWRKKRQVTTYSGTSYEYAAFDGWFLLGFVPVFIRQRTVWGAR